MDFKAKEAEINKREVAYLMKHYNLEPADENVLLNTPAPEREAKAQELAKLHKSAAKSRQATSVAQERNARDEKVRSGRKEFWGN